MSIGVEHSKRQCLQKMNLEGLYARRAQALLQDLTNKASTPKVILIILVLDSDICVSDAGGSWSRFTDSCSDNLPYPATHQLACLDGDMDSF